MNKPYLLFIVPTSTFIGFKMLPTILNPFAFLSGALENA
jgi:hypothetical protein